MYCVDLEVVCLPLQPVEWCLPEFGVQRSNQWSVGVCQSVESNAPGWLLIVAQKCLWLGSACLGAQQVVSLPAVVLQAMALAPARFFLAVFQCGSCQPHLATGHHKPTQLVFCQMRHDASQPVSRNRPVDLLTSPITHFHACCFCGPRRLHHLGGGSGQHCWSTPPAMHPSEGLLHRACCVIWRILAVCPSCQLGCLACQVRLIPGGSCTQLSGWRDCRRASPTGWCVLYSLHSCTGSSVMDLNADARRARCMAPGYPSA